MPLKIATWDDYADILSMTMKFGAMMYKDHFTFDEYKVAEGVRGFLDADPSERVIILAQNEKGENVGMLGAVCAEPPFSTEKLAFEQAWWMEPEFRNSRLALELVEAYEFWANRVGATYIQMASVDSDKSPAIDKYYKRRGYVPLERAYIKKNGSD